MAKLIKKYPKQILIMGIKRRKILTMTQNIGHPMPNSQPSNLSTRASSHLDRNKNSNSSKKSKKMMTISRLAAAMMTTIATISMCHPLKRNTTI